MLKSAEQSKTLSYCNVIDSYCRSELFIYLLQVQSLQYTYVNFYGIKASRFYGFNDLMNIHDIQIIDN